MAKKNAGFILRAWCFALVAGFVFFTVACKSPPKPVEQEPLVEAEETPAEEPQPETPAEEPQPETPAEPAVTQEMLGNLRAAKEKAALARQKSMDVNGQVFFAAEWKAVESGYVAGGKDINESDAASVDKAIAAYDSAAAGFEDITKRSLPLFADGKRAEVAKIRTEVLDTGIDVDLYGQYLDPAQEKFDAMNKLYESGDYTGTLGASKTALDYYTALKTAIEANVYYESIMENDLSKYDSANFHKGEGRAAAALEAYDKGDIAAALPAITEARDLAYRVYSTGWKSLATERRNAAAESRTAALNLKANVAVRGDYDAANAVNTQADRAYQSQQFVAASGLYQEAAAKFGQVAEAAAYKRRIADNAIREAERKVAESDETARVAEEILVGGEQ